MSSEFHPNLDYVISSSLDKTIRVWDIKLLREKNVISKNDDVFNEINNKSYGLSDSGYMDDEMDHGCTTTGTSSTVKHGKHTSNTNKNYNNNINVNNNDFLNSKNTDGINLYSFAANIQQNLYNNTNMNNNNCNNILSHNMNNINLSSSNNNNMFGASDAVCKFILEGHEKGVNCCTFHHTLPIIASGSDDKLVKLWRYNDNKAWELDTLRGHFNNVSSLLFHQTNNDLLLSNSEDRTIRIWDITKRTCIHTFRREHDRFWVLTQKPNSNLIASGHDSGMVIFKFDKEKCPHDKYENMLFYCKDKRIYYYNILTDTNISICNIRKNGNAMVSGYHKLIFNFFCTTYIMIIFIYKEEDNFFFDLIMCDCSSGQEKETLGSSSLASTALSYLKPWVRADNIKGKSNSSNIPNSVLSPNYTKTLMASTQNRNNEINVDSVKYLVKNKHCYSACFLSRNKYIFIDKKNNNYVLNIHNLPEDNLYKKIEFNFVIENVYALTNTKVLIFSKNKIYLYDINMKKILSEMHHTDIIIGIETYKNHIAFVFKYNVVITTIDLVHLCTVHEYVRVKSGVWDKNNPMAFIYNTSSHLKYILINGEKGTIKYIEQPIYLFNKINSRIYYIDRQQLIKSEILNDSEYMFKISLINNNEELAYQYLDMQHGSSICDSSNNSIIPSSNNNINNINGPKQQQVLKKKKLYLSYNLIGYIKKKGFANIAVQMVNNNHTLFNLSIQLGHLNNALKAAKKINKKHIWSILSAHALTLGNYEITEYCLHKNKEYDKLSFLYFFSGNINKLKKMLQLAIIRKDLMSIFLNSLYLGNIENRINVFIQQHQLNLALLCSYLYNIPINTSEQQSDLDISELINKLNNSCSFYLSPPIPIVKIDEKMEGDTSSNNQQTQNKSTLWNNSYNWPVINQEFKNNYRINKKYQPLNNNTFNMEQAETNELNTNELNTNELKTNELKTKYNKKNYNKISINSNNSNVNIENINDSREHLKGHKIYDDNDNDEIKSHDRSSSIEGNDIWNDQLNDEDIINVEISTENNKNDYNKKNTKIEKGQNVIHKSLKKNGKIIDYIRTGNINTALKLISKKYGIIDMKPIKTIIKNIYISTYAYISPIQNYQSLKILINKNEQTLNDNIYITNHFLYNQIKKAHKFVTLGKFNQALVTFRNILYSLIFINQNDEENKLNEYLKICTTYILVMRLEEERSRTSSMDPQRSLELMAHFTCCPLQNSHLYLVLRRGMGLAWKAQNYVTAGSFAKRLINGNYEHIKGSEEEIAKAKKILLMCEQKSTEQYNIDYDPNDCENIKICCVSLTKIKPTDEVVTCPFCFSIAKKEHNMKKCPNCVVAQLGIKVIGFDFLNKNF
uniref:Coatomer subunit alpha-like n=1 Tax=Piliocolobus tephrosceles TaxID=591936 RepID=A0A8C9GF71_9PRIM